MRDFRKKKWNTKKHAIKRAKERYGLSFRCVDLKNICDLIRDGESTALSQGRTCTRCRHLVEYNGRELIVVYSNTLKTIVTVLPNHGDEDVQQQ